MSNLPRITFMGQFCVTVECLPLGTGPEHCMSQPHEARNRVETALKVALKELNVTDGQAHFTLTEAVFNPMALQITALQGLELSLIKLLDKLKPDLQLLDVALFEDSFGTQMFSSDNGGCHSSLIRRKPDGMGYYSFGFKWNLKPELANDDKAFENEVKKTLKAATEELNREIAKCPK